MMFKKGARIFDVVMVMIIGIFVLTMGYSFIVVNANESGDVLDGNFSESINELEDDGLELNQKLVEFKDTAKDIEQAGYLEAGVLGFKGALAILLFPFNFFELALSSFNVSTGLINIGIPNQVITYLEMGLVAIILFAIIAFITNKGREP